MKNDIPKQIGLFVLQYAKLRMLQFYYDCLDRYLDRSDFKMAQMDTDSLYFAVSKYNSDQQDDLASHPLILMVKEGLLEEFKSHLYDHCQDDWEPDFAEHYFNKSTLSPGVYQQMLDVLQTREDKLAVNRGFRINKQQDNKMMTYQESKKAFNYFHFWT